MRRLTVLMLAVTLLVGGCGIPDQSDVTIVGPGPASGTAVGDSGVPPVQYTRESTDDPVQFIQYYLQAAAGDPETALDRVKAFMASDVAQGFAAGPDVKVVRLTDTPLYTYGKDEITLTTQLVGTLKSNGLLEPATEPARTQYTVRVAELPDKSGLWVTQVPEMLLLSDTALADYYQRRTIYFWNNERTGLVPDLRYMSRSVPTVQQPTTILSWLANGPAPWLSDTVEALPTGTTAPDNVPAIDKGTLQVSLNDKAVPAGDDHALNRLRTQLQWSLQPLAPRTLELKIGNQDPVRFINADYLESNPAYRLADVPERFVIFNGTIQRLKLAPHRSDPVPVLKPAANRGIKYAALSSWGTDSFAAVVTNTNQLRVATSPNGVEADLKQVGGLSGTLGRPVWAVTGESKPADAIGLITVNGRLYSFGLNGAPARPVDLQGNPGSISAVSVAPDGRRVALVSQGKLFRTVLNTGGDTIALDIPERLLPPNLTTIASVAWSSETYLAVAGKRSDGRFSVQDVSVDGALPYLRLRDIGLEPVTYLTAYAANPKNSEENSNYESYVAAGDAWDVLGDPVKIVASDLVGPVENVPGGTVPAEPFFLN